MTEENRADSPLLDVNDLRTWFRTPNGVVHAVDGVSLTLQRTHTLGIVGESGSGKSVFARSVIGLMPPRTTLFPSGEVRFEGFDLRKATQKQLQGYWGSEISLVSQNPMTALNPVVRIGRQITETLTKNLNLERREAQARAAELLREVGIPDPVRRLTQYPHELSGGMRQRVTIAIALACNPKLLIADEPTTALDVTVQAQILDLLERQRDERSMSMILISHDLGVMAGRTDFIAVMYAGKVVEYAPTRTLFTSTRMPYTEALLKAIPKITSPPHSRLDAIGGLPPNLIDPPKGCRFYARCRYAQPQCAEEEPELRPAESPAHQFACFFPVGTPEGEQALARNSKSKTTDSASVGVEG